MKSTGVVVMASALLVAGCAPTGAGFQRGSVESCAGALVVVNDSFASAESVCVEFDAPEAIASDVVSFAGFDVEGTQAYGDQVVCRVNDFPSASEPLVVPGEDPYLETCQDMPPAFAYWALWVKAEQGDSWEYATDGIGTLRLTPGMSVGLAFATAGETPTPSDP